MRKLNGLIVWALIDNTAACNFYWRAGAWPIASAFTKIGGDEAGEGRVRLALVVRFWHSHPFSVVSRANVRIKRTTSKFIGF